MPEKMGLGARSTMSLTSVDPFGALQRSLHSCICQERLVSRLRWSVRWAAGVLQGRPMGVLLNPLAFPNSIEGAPKFRMEALGPHLLLSATCRPPRGLGSCETGSCCPRFWNVSFGLSHSAMQTGLCSYYSWDSRAVPVSPAYL